RRGCAAPTPARGPRRTRPRSCSGAPRCRRARRWRSRTWARATAGSRPPRTTAGRGSARSLDTSDLLHAEPRRGRVVGPGLDVDGDAGELLAQALHHALDRLGLERLDRGPLGLVVGVELPGELLRQALGRRLGGLALGDGLDAVGVGLAHGVG